MNQIQSAVVKIGVINLVNVMASINPNEIKDLISIATSLIVAIHTLWQSLKKKKSSTAPKK